MDLWLANPARPAHHPRTSIAALDMPLPRLTPQKKPKPDDEPETPAGAVPPAERAAPDAARGPFDLVFAIGASLALWGLIALIVLLIFF